MNNIPEQPSPNISSLDAIHQKINKINSLKTRLKNKLITLDIISSNDTYALYELVNACIDISTGVSGNLTSQYYMQGSASPTLNLTPSAYDSSAIGFSRVYPEPDRDEIYSDIILEGHKIMGINGIGVTAYTGLRFVNFETTGKIYNNTDDSIFSIPATVTYSLSSHDSYEFRPRQIVIYKNVDDNPPNYFENGAKLVISAVITLNDNNSPTVEHITFLYNASPGKPVTGILNSASIALEPSGTIYRHYVLRTNSSTVKFFGKYYVTLFF